jgi:hypothetical protein
LGVGRAQKLLFDVNKISRRALARERKKAAELRVREPNHTLGSGRINFLIEFGCFGRENFFFPRKTDYAREACTMEGEKKKSASVAANMIE